MGRKVDSGLCNTQKKLNFAVNYVEDKADQDPDFYVGYNGGVLPKKYKHWIGDNKREAYLKKIRNRVAYNFVDQNYRPHSFIGDGGTGSALMFEFVTGLGLGRYGGTHLEKAKNEIKHANNILKKYKITGSERKTIKAIRKKMGIAIMHGGII